MREECTFESIFDNAPAPLVACNSNGIIEQLNKRAINILDNGAEPASFIGKSLLNFLEPNSELSTKLSAFIEEGKTTFDLKRAPHNDITLTLRGRPCCDGTVVMLENVSKEVKSKSELKRNAKRLEKQNKELEQFNYIASHDLQEPLNTTQSFVDLLSDELADSGNPEAKQYLKIVREQTDRMKQQITGLLEYSRVGRMNEIEEVDTASSVNEVLDSLKKLIAENNVKVEVGKLPKLRVYTHDFQSLILNLLTNAIKYKRKDTEPSIKISATDKTSHIQFSVKDNGIGIEKQHFERIFIIFQRLFRRDEFPGTGIGLSLCKKIVELHEGEIWIESEVGKGSTFYFTVKKDFDKIS